MSGIESSKDLLKYALDEGTAKEWTDNYARSKTRQTKVWYDVMDGFAVTLVRLKLI